MALAPRVLIAGASGVFGRRLTRELAERTPARFLLAGRRLDRAARVVEETGLSARAEPLGLDLADHDAVARSAIGCFAVVCAAGPFQGLPPAAAAAVVSAGAHWLDIADDERWILSLLSDDALATSARAAGLTVAPGLSTTPALSGALVRWCAERVQSPRRARITLWIGNRNAKGAGAVASALSSGFESPVIVHLPHATSRAWLFRSADSALLARELGIEAEFRVAFEWPLSNWLMERLQRRDGDPASRLARPLAFLARPASRVGSDRACLQAEVFGANGEGLAAWFLARGQRMAVLPAAIVVEALLSGERIPPGCVSPAEILSAGEWIARCRSRGLEFGSGDPARSGL